MQAIQPHTKKFFPLPTLLILLLIALLAVGGALYWHSRGQVSFQGVFKENLSVIAATGSGVVTRIEVSTGQHAQRGHILLRLDDAALRKALLAEQEKLSQLKKLLPPQLIRVPGQQGSGADEAITDRLERQRRDEESALLRYQEATDREAEALVLYNRVTLLSARNAVTPEQRDAAERTLAEAKRNKEAARQVFETLSLARASTSKEINRIRNEQAAVGANGLTVEARVTLYRQQQERVAMAAAAFESAVVAAPDNGIVAGVFAQPGQRVEAGAPLLLFQTEGSSAKVTATVLPEISRRLKPGQPCRVQGLGESDVQGYIESLKPAAPDSSHESGEEETSAQAAGGRAADQTQVTIALLPGPDGSGNTPAAPENNAGVSVTVLLREPLYVVPAPRPAAERKPVTTGQPEDYYEQAPPASAGQAIPPAPSLSVQTPFGAYPEQPAPPDASTVPPSPATLGGPPSVKGQTPPVLPPMQAPYPLTGSPLPDARNNPSVVPEIILNPAESAPR